MAVAARQKAEHALTDLHRERAIARAKAAERDPTRCRCNERRHRTPGRPIPPREAVLFCRHGLAIIALGKPPQLSDWIGKAIGQRPALLSAGVPALLTDGPTLILYCVGMAGMIPARER
jgi:hypothetical protein